MQLPQDLQHFPKATLLVVSDRITAKFWLLGGDTMEELDGVALPHEHNQDQEGVPSYTGNEDAERFHKFIHMVVECINSLVRDQQIMHVHLVMPTEVDHEVTEHLPGDVTSKVGKHVRHDVMQEDPYEIVKRVLNA